MEEKKMKKEIIIGIILSSLILKRSFEHFR